MSKYTPPYTNTSKILKLSIKIADELTKLEFDEKKARLMLRKREQNYEDGKFRKRLQEVTA